MIDIFKDLIRSLDINNELIWRMGDVDNVDYGIVFLFFY